MFGLAMFFFSFFTLLVLNDIHRVITNRPMKSGEDIFLLFATIVIGVLSELGLRKIIKRQGN
ncbi:MAG: hypothetical protein HYT65_00305 [Candidatus Yanofskybacteria bacterium]|nr:hypothetical protein [Candidatus Yanofskybacteria bacterium]